MLETRYCCHVVNLANRETAVVISAPVVALETLSKDFDNNILYLYSAFPTPKVTLQVRLKEQRKKDINTWRHNIQRDESNTQRLVARLD